jgi:phosphoribosylformylglycinamidine cyclo-ligase
MTDPKDTAMTYSDAGVDIERGATLVERIKPAVKRTNRSGVAGELGGFGGLFALAECGFEDPVLVSATDGVGTKLKLAIETQRHTTIGIDLVAMCVNDIIVQGAEPLFFLDYFASGRLDVDTAQTIIEGIASGCEIAGCALLGGETAEMPDMYRDEDYDLAGFCVGAVDRDNLLDGRTITPGNVLLGLGSSGLHSNGYSLVRRILSARHIGLTTPFEDRTLADVLLEPTRIYVKPLLETLKRFDVRGLAHITGGGLTENLPRILPPGVVAEIDLDAWTCPSIIDWLRRTGPVEDEELLKTFNCGIGMIAVVDGHDAGPITDALREAGETVEVVGQISAGDGTAVAYHGNL